MRSLLVAAPVIAMALFIAIAAAPATASAATLAQKRAQAAKLDAEVAKLEQRYDALQERYRGALWELEKIRGEVAEAHRVVKATRRDRRTASNRLAERASAIYRSGGAGGDIAELATAGSFSDFFDRLETRRRVSSQDATVLERVETLNRKVEAKERVLREAQSKAAAATRRARTDERRMKSILAQRTEKLNSVNADIRAIMDAQRRAAEARAAAEARRTAARVTPDAPGGTTGGGASAPTSDGGASSGAGGGVAIPLPPASGTAAAAANAAMGKLGTPYQWAGSGPDRFDCSGLVMWAFAQAGRPGLPHSTYALVTMGVNVPLSQLQVGDLVFPSHNGHVGIYIGGGNFVHAPSTGDVVKVTSMAHYSISHARRI